MGLPRWGAQGLGFKGQKDLGFRVWGLGFRGYRAWGSRACQTLLCFYYIHHSSGVGVASNLA